MIEKKSLVEYTQIRYELPEPEIARIVMARPDTRNAQSLKMLYEINHAFDVAAKSSSIKVIIFAGDGPHFSSGHDLTEERNPLDYDLVVQAVGHHEPGAAGMYAGEEEYFTGLHWKWRNEYFLHAWDLGPRKAKEMLFAGETLTAQECKELGMVNHVVPIEELEDATLNLARRIASRPAIGLKLAKQAVNFSMDVQGQHQALTGALAMHHIGHAHARVQYGYPVDPNGAAVIKNDAKVARKVNDDTFS